ncbi:MAG TPA: hypothetical protein VFQ61_38085 [Polyangiaceae bacterium]|nr:hypothetical protein [Polyangiaceae bacterium]
MRNGFGRASGDGGLPAPDSPPSANKSETQVRPHSDRRMSPLTYNSQLGRAPSRRAKLI